VEDILSNEPWHQIPESLIEENKSLCWKSNIEIQLDSEFCTEDVENQLPEIKLHRLMNNEDDEFGTIVKLKRDPPVPPFWTTNIVYCEIEDLYSASQFSNTGALPLFEYYLREKVVPHTILLPNGRPKFTRRNKEYTSLPLVIIKNHKKEKETKREQDLTEELWDPDPGEKELVEGQPNELDDLLVVPEIRSNTHHRPVIDDSIIDMFLKLGDTHLEEVGNAIAAEWTDGMVSVLDGDEDLDFGLFDEA
jgi:hypothetical protein